MIQRKQTLYLLGIAVLMAVMMFLPLTTVVFGGTPGVSTETALDGTITKTTVLSNTNFELNAWGLFADGVKKVDLIYLAILVFVAIGCAIITIFFFKKRKLQSKLTLFIGLIVLAVVALVAVNVYELVQLAATDTTAVIKYSIALLCPLLSLACVWFAYGGIKKDIELVRSLDRIR